MMIFSVTTQQARQGIRWGGMSCFASEIRLRRWSAPAGIGRDPMQEGVKLGPLAGADLRRHVHLMSSGSQGN
jgi:hypothetical protein